MTVGQWAPVEASASYTGLAEYRLEADGLVRFRGTITQTVVGAILAIPVEARPLATPMFIDWEPSPLSALIQAPGEFLIVGAAAPVGEEIDISPVVWFAPAPAPVPQPFASGPVLHPATAGMVRDVLAEAMTTDDVVVGREVPNPRPARFITVKRFGGGSATVVSDRPHIGVEVWAGNPDTAEELAQRARQILHGLAGTVVAGTIVYRVTDVAMPNDLPHPSGQPRHAFTVELHVRSQPP